MAGQFFDDNLPSGQAFQIGGAIFVRGYAKGLASADKGAFANIELQWSLSNKLNFTSAIAATPMVFIDQGVVYPFLRMPRSLQKKILASACVVDNFDVANAILGQLRLAFR